ncbi:MAG TPA: hypothetical protein VN455_02265 [Methanotrichaceae archaeon]|nr:hypothetical protein [Methanotrichaceae archaeon]
MKEFRLARAIRRAFRRAKDDDLLQERFYFQEVLQSIYRKDVTGKGVLAE